MYVYGGTTGSRLISDVKHRRAWVVLGWVTTWEVRGYRLSFYTKIRIFYERAQNFVYIRLRPYHGETTGSRLISDVKHRWAWVVLGWVTTWEVRVL